MLAAGRPLAAFALQAAEAGPQLDELRGMVSDLGDKVEGMLIQAAHLLQRCDLQGLEQLGDDEQSVRELRLAVEMGCLSLIAAQRPRNGNLRSAVAMIEIASELEQMGAHARQIARANYLSLERCFGTSLQSIRHLSNEVQTLLHQAMQAVPLSDEPAVQAVFARALQLEPLYEAVHQELLLLMRNRPRFANQAIHLARSVNHLKQAADRVTSICEWIIYSIRGEDHVTSNV
jgi:phosphate transport system protein